MLTPWRLHCAVPVDVDDLKIDLLSISAHKIYGPKGIGALYVRRRPRVRLEPIISGGGQERGLRSGTVAAPLVVGFGEACRLAKKEMAVSAPLLCPRVCVCALRGGMDGVGGAARRAAVMRLSRSGATSTRAQFYNRADGTGACLPFTLAVLLVQAGRTTGCRAARRPRGSRDELVQGFRAAQARCPPLPHSQNDHGPHIIR